MTLRSNKRKAQNARRIKFNANARFGKSESLAKRLQLTKQELESMNKKVA